MADKDAARKAHVHRVYKDNDQDSDAWIDIERIDQLVFEHGKGITYMKQTYKFDWADFDPDDAKTTIWKKIKNPDDESDFIEVPVRRFYAMETQARGPKYQLSTYTPDNSKDNTMRDTRKRKVDPYDVPPSAIDSKGNPPRLPRDYVDAVKGSPSGGTPLEVEIISAFITEHGEGITYMKHIWSLKSDEDILMTFGNTEWLKAYSNKRIIGSPEEIDPPWRLDPLQNIVNFSFGGMAVIFGPEATDAPKQEKKK